MNAINKYLLKQKIKSFICRGILFILRKKKSSPPKEKLPKNTKTFGYKNQKYIYRPIDNGPLVIKTRETFKGELEFTNLYWFPRIALNLIKHTIKSGYQSPPPLTINLNKLYSESSLGELLPENTKLKIAEHDINSVPLLNKMEFVKSLKLDDTKTND
jgi:hypothetical protein